MTVVIASVLSFPVMAQVQAPERAPTIPGEVNEMPDGRGFIPSRMELRHLDARDMAPRLSSADPLPARFDWRETGKVTSVKNQSVCGACYAFAALGNIEAKMEIDLSETFDFSENSAKECNYYGTSCSGGNFDNLASYLSQNGVVTEACDPYVAADVSCNGSCQYIKTLLGWNIISADFVPATASLKQYIYDNGPVYSSLYTGDNNDNAWMTEYNNYDGTYTMHYTGDHTINHAILIVGWDDNLVHAGGTGGWIVKNSWGTGWGGTCGYGAEGGYFYIAYGSAGIGKYSSFMSDWQDYNSSGGLLHYDEAGWTSQWGYGATTVWGLCGYTLAAQSYLTRVEFWTNDATTDVDIYLYDDFNGSSPSNLLASSLDNSFPEAGYHSISLASPPQVNVGEDVYVVAKFTAASYTYPLVADGAGPTETGKTYMSSTGGSGSWYDLGTNPSPADIALRIRTSPTLVLGVDDDSGPLPDDYLLQQNYPNPFNPATTIQYSVAVKSHVTIDIHNLLGQNVTRLIDETKSAGTYSVEWDGCDADGRDVASGIYFYTLRTDAEKRTRKMVLLR